MSCIGQCPLAEMLHRTLEHGSKEPVERHKFSYFHLSCIFGNGERDIDQGAFISLDLLIHKVHIDERVQHLHDELELVRNKWIAGDKVLLAGVSLIGAGKDKLGIQFGFVLLKHFAKRDFDITFLFKNTLLCDILWRSALQRSAYLKTSQDFSYLILWIGSVATHIGDYFLECLLCSAGYPAT